jgi:hypothetical protein
VKSLHALAYFIQFCFQRLAFVIFIAAALALLGATLMATFGQWSWISIPLQYNNLPVDNAGMYVQIGLTVLAIGICFFLPSNRRIMQLENSHRGFSVGMHDVARAYSVAHAKDRAASFQLSSEFDSVRERLAFMRNHPDLSSLEPGLLEVAAQMSHLSSELATVYSDEKVARARNFLTQRQEETDLFNERLEQAKAISNDLKHWAQQVDLDESVAAAQLDRLRAELREVMPEMGLEAKVPNDPTTLDNTIVDLPAKAAE